MGNRFAPSLRISVVFTAFILVWMQLGSAQVATSTNYQLQSDSINFGGGLSTSTNYRQESTFGEIATGEATSTNYNLYAGYQQMQEVFLSMTAPSDVILSPNLAGLTGGTSNGSTTVTVTTDSPAGYSLTLESQNNPAMQNGVYTIDDYDEGADADFSFLVTAGVAHLGFSPSGVDVAQEFKDNGSLCGVSSQDTALACWAGLSTLGTVISEGTDANHPSGATTTISFRVGIGSGAGVVSGVYTATTTLTALPL
ncbi:MAG: hypothetical protein KBC62_00910 [Candidatus Pacebacteria bacterium]|nr:hypothetical protein [Candidatus Paceibacterota bacterium]MBP9842542.1 hypothetical protein [Candidatus Paceibacterota bacterium]